MSAIVGRTAAAALRTTAGQRSFSLLTSLRSVARSMEAHPFERLPVSQRSQPAVWSQEAKRVGKQAALFFPGIALLLGWPALAKGVVNMANSN